MDTAQFPAYCPMCRADAAGNVDKLKRGPGLIEDRTLTFLQRRGIIEKDFQFRFMLQAFKDRGEKFFRCPSNHNCGNWLLSAKPGEIIEVKGAKIVREKKIGLAPCGAAVCLVCHVEIPRFVKPLTKGTKEPAVGDAVRARLARQRPSVRPGVVVPGRAAAIAQIMQRPAVAVADRLPRSLSRLGSFEGGDDEGGDAAAEDGADNDPWMHAKIEKVLEEGAVVRWATGAQSAVVEVAVVNGEGIEMRANLDLEAANENRHATFVAWSDIEVPLPIEQIAQAHECPEDKLSQEEMDDETRKTMESMGKRCPVCHSFIQKNDGCDWMSCGTTAHGSLKDCIRNGGCGIAFQWNSGTVADDPCGWKDLDGSHKRGRPVTARQLPPFTHPKCPSCDRYKCVDECGPELSFHGKKGSQGRAEGGEHCCRECRESGGTRHGVFCHPIHKEEELMRAGVASADTARIARGVPDAASDAKPRAGPDAPGGEAKPAAEAGPDTLIQEWNGIGRNPRRWGDRAHAVDAPPVRFERVALVIYATNGGDTVQLGRVQLIDEAERDVPIADISINNERCHGGGGEHFRNLIVADRRKWCTQMSYFPDSTPRIEFTLRAPAAVAGLVLTAANDCPERDPARFALFGVGAAALSGEQLEAMRAQIGDQFEGLAADIDAIAHEVGLEFDDDCAEDEKVRQVHEALFGGGGGGGGGGGPAFPAPPALRKQPSLIQLPPGIKACPACGMLLEKISGDDTMMCGCEAKPAGGNYRKALAGGGCGHEFNFSTLAPLGCGRPGAPANERQVNF